MEEDRGPVLTTNILTFGIITFCIVIWRICFRLYNRKTTASDWFLAAALVGAAFIPLPITVILRASISKEGDLATGLIPRSRWCERIL